jgi:hypothetical protein
MPSAAGVASFAEASQVPMVTLRAAGRQAGYWRELSITRAEVSRTIVLTQPRSREAAKGSPRKPSSTVEVFAPKER